MLSSSFADRRSRTTSLTPSERRSSRIARGRGARASREIWTSARVIETTVYPRSDSSMSSCWSRLRSCSTISTTPRSGSFAGCFGTEITGSGCVLDFSDSRAR